MGKGADFERDVSKFKIIGRVFYEKV